jgi:hypothetical protein
MQFVTLPQQQRPAEMQQAEQQLKQQQEQPNNPEKFECGKPYMPCGSAIPEGKTCKQGERCSSMQKCFCQTITALANVTHAS